jgi:HEAT repeat protein
VVTGERLTGMIGRISQASPGEAARIEELVGKMRDWIFPTLLEILADSSDKAVRKMVLDLLDLEDGVPAQHLWPMMEDPRWYVVRNAVQLATGSGDPELAGHLERLLRHPDARVRREVMRSLDTLGGSRSAALLVRALNDEDSSVRILAAHGLGRHGNRGHIASVQVHVESRDFETRPSEEIAAFLLAFAGLGGEATVDVLNKMWKRRVFGTRPLPLRLAAIQALGAVASPAAREALTAAARSRDAQLRRVAARALAEAQARIMGTST